MELCGMDMFVPIVTENVVKNDKDPNGKWNFQMDKIRLFMYGILLVVILMAVGPTFLKDDGVSQELQEPWNKEISTIEQTCGRKVNLPSRVFVTFGDTEGAIGYCQRFVNGFKIVIDKSFWDFKLDAPGKRQLLLHEMMHCIFKTKHNLEDPHNFMYPEYGSLREEELLMQLKIVLKETGKCD